MNYPNKILFELINDPKVTNIKRLFMEEETLKFLVFLFKILKPKKILELGSCVGFSVIYLASIFKHTKFTSIEHNAAYFELSKYYLAKAKLKNICFVCDNISNYQKTVKDNTYDIIIEDSKKALYTKHLEENIRIAKNDGLIIADDIMLDKTIYPEKITKHLDAFKDLVKNHKNLETIFINVGNGISVSKVINN